MKRIRMIGEDRASRSGARQSVNILSGRDPDRERARAERFENKILKNPQNEGPNPTSESKKPVAMVLVHVAVSSPKARGQDWISLLPP